MPPTKRARAPRATPVAPAIPETVSREQAMAAAHARLIAKGTQMRRTGDAEATYRCGNRPIQIPGATADDPAITIAPGDVVPGAGDWPHLDAYLSSGRLIGDGDVYRCGDRPMKLPDGGTAQPGDVVVGAENWPTVQSWVRTGRLVPA